MSPQRDERALCQPSRAGSRRRDRQPPDADRKHTCLTRGAAWGAITPSVEQLDELAADLGTNRSELIRRGAQALIDAEQLAEADRELQAAYRRTPADPALVRSARRLAAETGPAW
ncbi:MAG: ribbon-helix-helix protein, CopG family [Acidimicrobiales bacterium]